MTWPSSFAPDTQGYMIDRISDELMRSDLTTQIQAAITDAIALYQKVQFRFNDTFTSGFTTVAGQQNYTVLDDPNYPAVISPAQFFYINTVLITVPPANFELVRVQPSELLVLSQSGTQQGMPEKYAYDNENIMLYPIPSSAGPGQIQSFAFIGGGSGYSSGSFTNVSLTGGNGASATANIVVVGGVVISVALVNAGTGYQVGDTLSATTIGPGSGFSIQVASLFSATQGPYRVTILGHATYAAPASNTETGNHWMMTSGAERLIRSRAKYQIATHVTRNGLMAAAMSPNPQGNGETADAFRELKTEANRMQRRGYIQPMPF